jgi:hypothetical protein
MKVWRKKKLNCHFFVPKVEGKSVDLIFCSHPTYETTHFFSFFKTTTFRRYIYPDGIRSHNPMLQSPQWQAETIPLDHAARPTFILEEFFGRKFPELRQNDIFNHLQVLHRLPNRLSDVSDLQLLHIKVIRL